MRFFKLTRTRVGVLLYYIPVNSLLSPVYISDSTSNVPEEKPEDASHHFIKVPLTNNKSAYLDVMRLTCLFAHVSLIVVLIMLIALQPRLKSRLYMDTWETDLVWEGLTKAFAYLVTGWTIVLTVTTQRLALRRQLNLDNTLTAKHDANMAWMGAGSALLTSLNWRQHKFKDSVDSILIPLAYLGVLSAFHSSATGIFDTFSAKNNVTLPFSTYGVPNLTGTLQNTFVGADSLMTMVSLDTFNFPGLADDGSGVIYDIPVHPNRIYDQVPEYVQHLAVNATYFNVTCGSLSGSIQDVDGTPAFVFESDFGVENSLTPDSARLDSTILPQNGLVIRTAPWGPILAQDDPKSLWPSSILIFTTVTVLDSSNVAVEPAPVNPPVTYFPYSNSTTESITHVSALACNLTVDVSSTKALIYVPDSSLKELTGGSGSKNSSNLTPFPSDLSGTPMDIDHSVTDALVATWSVLPTRAVSSLDELLLENCIGSNNSIFTCGTLYESEQFVMESLNIFPDIFLPGPSSTSINLVDLENVLSRMAAIEFWSEGQGINSNFSNRLFNTVNTENLFVTNENILKYHEEGFRYALDITELSLSLGFAIILLALAMPALCDRNHLIIDSVGILQMIWLANDHPEDHKYINEIQIPTTKALREGGLRIKRNYNKAYNHPAVAVVASD
ncbi:hypothetical protein F5050DRAFT_1309223 [Lentinula boryana]|uniref:Uncharacterized protein n=1 Tax=Lentinula boryana TaxID=40481 RepID=A0ABQ8QHJ8_9AGAR|nr:hypothetical protein F5050DRAFT_1309223 [Lentinula boryana]